MEKLSHSFNLEDDVQIQLYNKKVTAFQSEHRFYVQELEVIVKQIKSIFDGPSSGINGDTVDVIFGNIIDILDVESSIKSAMEEMTIISSPGTVLAVGSVFYEMAMAEFLEVYVYYANNYTSSRKCLETFDQYKETLKSSLFRSSEALTFEMITSLLEVLLFKPIQHVTSVLATIRELLSCLRNTSLGDRIAQRLVIAERKLLKETTTRLCDMELALQDALNEHYSGYRYFSLHLVPRDYSCTNTLKILFSSYMTCMVHDKKLELKLLEITEEMITISTLDERSKNMVKYKNKYPISQVTAVTDYYNDLNQFSITLQDQKLELLPGRGDDKDQVITVLTILLSRRVILRGGRLKQGTLMYSQEYDQVYCPPTERRGALDTLVDRLVQGAITEPQFTLEFLTLYKLFTSSRVLLALLQTKFEQNTPAAANGTGKSERLKIFSVLKMWLCVNKRDFVVDGLLSSNLLIFLDSCKKDRCLAKWADLLKRVLECEEEEEEEGNENILQQIYENDDSELDLLSLNSADLARQITLIEHGYFAKLQISDVLVGRGEVLSAMREFQDRYSLWMRRAIVETCNFEERCVAIKCIFETMKNLYELQNFSGTMALYNVIHSAEIFRLKHSTRHCILLQYSGLLEEIEKLVEDGMQGYWRALEYCTGPAVPIIGTYKAHVLRNKHVFIGAEFIDFEACRAMYDKVSRFNCLQNSSFSFPPVLHLKRFLNNLCPYERKTRKEFLADLYLKSLVVEPLNGPPTYFPRTTTHDLTQFLGWKSTSVKPLPKKDTPKESSKDDKTSEKSSKKDRRGSTLKKSKSFSSRRGPPAPTPTPPPTAAPPLPPRIQAINRSNCLSRSRSFNTEQRNPYDAYELPEKNIQSGFNEKRSVSPIMLQNLPFSTVNYEYSPVPKQRLIVRPNIRSNIPSSPSPSPPLARHDEKPPALPAKTLRRNKAVWPVHAKQIDDDTYNTVDITSMKPSRTPPPIPPKLTLPPPIPPRR